MDKSNGYESIASVYINGRGQAINGIGTSCVRSWAKTLPKKSTVLDIGCGTGKPVSKIFVDKGMVVYGIDASPTMVKTFRQNFPASPVVCEAAEESSFFGRKFDGIISWGLIFLLPRLAQEIVIQKSATALDIGGRFLFTSVRNKTEWKDGMAEKNSLSLGAEEYRELIREAGLLLIDEFEDEGENYY